MSSFRKTARDGKTIRAQQCGKCWIVERSVPVGDDFTRDPVLTLAFVPLLFGTRKFEEAMWLTEHCDAIPQAPVAGYWANVGNVRAQWLIMVGDAQ